MKKSKKPRGKSKRQKELETRIRLVLGQAAIETLTSDSGPTVGDARANWHRRIRDKMQSWANGGRPWLL